MNDVIGCDEAKSEVEQVLIVIGPQYKEGLYVLFVYCRNSAAASNLRFFFAIFRYVISYSTLKNIRNEVLLCRGGSSSLALLGQAKRCWLR